MHQKPDFYEIRIILTSDCKFATKQTEFTCLYKHLGKYSPVYLRVGETEREKETISRNQKKRRKINLQIPDRGLRTCKDCNESNPG